VNPRDLDRPRVRCGRDSCAPARPRRRAVAGRRRASKPTADSTPRAFVAALGATLALPVMPMDALHAATPAFDVLPYAEALARECAPVRTVRRRTRRRDIGDPLDERFRLWADERIDVPFAWLPRASRRPRRVAVAAGREPPRDGEPRRRIRGVEGADRHVAEDLARVDQRRREPGGPLVNATLYDALKQAASTSTSNRCRPACRSSTASTA
jgi:general secretion pathway protein E